MDLPEIADFRHRIPIRVRTFDVDSQGIVHNAVYLQYFEIGRVEYIREFEYKIDKNGIFNNELKVVVVNNTINYHFPAFLDDSLNVYTRIKWIKNSSFCFEHVIENDTTKQILCSGSGILVNLNIETNLPEPLGEKFIRLISDFENKLEILTEND
ncbi:MAG: acyl-CoA thioesterase [Ignavibacteriae bacterium]|nr:acyl-CoA thioesterase [Ignavibacteriota bacterium]